MLKISEVFYLKKKKNPNIFIAIMCKNDLHLISDNTKRGQHYHKIKAKSKPL